MVERERKDEREAEHDCVCGRFRASSILLLISATVNVSYLSSCQVIKLQEMRMKSVNNGLLEMMLTECYVGIESSQDNHCPSCVLECSFMQFISYAVIETDAGLACRANVIIAPRGGQL